MKRVISSLLFFFLCSSVSLSASPKQMFREQLIGGAVKSLANTYIGAYDIEKSRKFALGQVETMSSAKFTRLNSHVGSLLKDLPPDVKAKYQLEPMSKEHMIVLIKTLQPRDLQDIIRLIPNSAIRRQVDWGIRRVGGKIDPNDFLSQIRIVQQKAQKILDKIQQYQEKVPETDLSEANQAPHGDKQ